MGDPTATRAHRRYAIRLEVRVGAAKAYTANLSMGGAAVEMPEPMPVGSQVHIAFAVPGGEVELGATVRYCIPRSGAEGFFVGLRFDAPTDSQRAALEQAVRRADGSPGAS